MTLDNAHKYTMKVVTRRTGLSPHVIRVWERRYGAVEPGRTESNRRRYSEADIARLQLLRNVTLAGHSISSVANLSSEELTALAQAETYTRIEPAPARDGAPLPEDILAQCLALVKAMDLAGLDTALAQAEIGLSQPVLLEQVIAPLMRTIGDMWHDGALRVAHEHLATAVLRSFLGALRTTHAANEAAPALVVTTPAAQLHEIGALLVAATAASQGWRIIYLGPNLPAVEIAAAVAEVQARAVALSIVYPSDDPHLPGELRRLRALLPDSAAVLTGGRAVGAYSSVLNEIGALVADDMSQVRSQLDALRAL
jgi:methanogenic corrinoid protein MtbC1